MSSGYDSNNSFNAMSRIGSDTVDSSNRNLTNTQYSKYNLENYHGNSDSLNTQVKFASSLPTMTATGLVGGSGLNGSLIDVDSTLMLKTEQQRSYAKLNLIERSFITVPYLGRGSCDPVLESKLLQGELELLKKSTGTMTELSGYDYGSYPIMDSIKKTVTDPTYSIEESAMSGWVRGGIASREVSKDSDFSKTYRPNNNI